VEGSQGGESMAVRYCWKEWTAL